MEYVKLTDDDINLLKKAKDAQDKAYAIYSGFKVGAAVLTQDNKIYTGCNIENASYSLTICAERVALFNAISDCAGKIKMIAVIGPEDSPISPCGACRQVMYELAKKAIVLLSNKDMDKVIKTTVYELLPYAFLFSQNP